MIVVNVNGAAQRFEVSPDGLVYTFHLRADGKWSNGDPVTADDFVYALGRLQDPATGAEYDTAAYSAKNCARFIGSFCHEAAAP